ncbi:MAG: molybdopterin-binding/glycosyltransferase family 2 protein [Aestuariivirga sp.]|uniref:molybdopterin-binding/glycosyltransferase family 2 protein n=1 Tax=Aestuariivirga sp. TaxID=2650926 RepID=UPI0025BB21E0|nr:molybdopterin-binding/glycosyltransferase family 2 protein [Aestuariivirga sp.]MCA3560596.1 molybdopterin-binding/glycosyltransferase family 2 protein [Aestuariivirga sp.]
MQFGELPLSEAEGAILAHSVKHDGGMFKKGRTLTADDIAILKASGVGHVFAAKLGTEDVPEDEAAAAVAQRIGAEGTKAQAPFTGRANLHAACHGLALVDVDRVRALNRLHESLTLATVQPFAIVEEREMVATVKVIPFAVPRDVLDKALAVIGTEPLVRVAAFRDKRAGLVITRLPQTKPAIISKSEDAMRERIGALCGTLAAVRVVAHEIAPVTAAIAGMQAMACDPILVFGASAITDRGDVIPVAVTKAGGQVLHLGMPVDPGNLMMLGALGDVPVIGVPSCARSPKLNGFDWVLARVMAGVKVTPEDIMDMGAGGLLAEIPTRPSPREGKPKPQRAPRVAAVVLAAGQSSRMASNKLLADLQGQPMIRRTVAAMRQAADVTVVVTGRDAAEVAKALEGLPVTLVHNRHFAQGMSTSLRAGMEALPPDTDAAVIALGDMPLVGPEAVRRLIAAYSPAEHRSICVPAFRGERGNPVLWGRQHFETLKGMTGDRGARVLFDQLSDEIVDVEMPDGAVLLDADTPEALAALRGRMRAGAARSTRST